jgi:hypothetical protein
MEWWNRFLGRIFNKPINGAEYRTVSTLFSSDGLRSAEILKFREGYTYLLEAERVEGSDFKERHDGRLVGPFTSPKHAEQFIVSTVWFNGDKIHSN